jgi:hypothetical protein
MARLKLRSQRKPADRRPERSSRSPSPWRGSPAFATADYLAARQFILASERTFATDPRNGRGPGIIAWDDRLAATELLPGTRTAARASAVMSVWWTGELIGCSAPGARPRVAPTPRHLAPQEIATDSSSPCPGTRRSASASRSATSAASPDLCARRSRQVIEVFRAIGWCRRWRWRYIIPGDLFAGRQDRSGAHLEISALEQRLWPGDRAGRPAQGAEDRDRHYRRRLPPGRHSSDDLKM